MLAKKYTPEAVAQIRKLSPSIKQPLRALIDELAKNPYLGKPLRADLDGFWSVRHQRYRVIYTIESKYISIAYLGKRENVYSQFEKLLALHKSRSI